MPADSSFQYDTAYLERPDSYPVSPELALHPSRTYTGEDQSLFGAFSDAAPGEWGQKLIGAFDEDQLRFALTAPVG
ncbi:hypothetical protein [Microbacterium sp.]|uniref:hypothetical protein n=1 Tax=Microbacterium sp. TaxID=51671 RepID=UPI003A89A863